MIKPITKMAFAIASDEAESWSDNIQCTLLDHQPMIDLLTSDQAPSWWVALRRITRRWECAKYNEDGTEWIVVDIDSSDHQACQNLNRLFPGLLKSSSVFDDVAKVLDMEPQS